MNINNTINPTDLFNELGNANSPLLIDVRRSEIFQQSKDIIPSAQWCHHLCVEDFLNKGDFTLTTEKKIVLYCAHGQQLSSLAAAMLRSAGMNAVVLKGGIEQWQQHNLPTISLSQWQLCYDKHWLTKENTTLDGLACVWFIKRFINPAANIHYITEQWAAEAALENQSIIFNINQTDTLFNHNDNFCCFNRFIDNFAIKTTALTTFAKSIGAINTKTNTSTPIAYGLHAIYQGLLALHTNDIALQQHSLPILDSLYQYCKETTQ